MLPTDPKARKAIPIITGCLDYFPLALAAVARLSKKANEKHNPGQPMHWSRGKSSDHADALGRHLMERNEIDPETDEGFWVHVAWRALAIAQEREEARSRSTPLGQPLPPPGPVVPLIAPVSAIPPPPAEDE